MAVYTSNVGIQVLYRCEYPTNVDISSQAFDVQVKVYNKIYYQRRILRENFEFYRKITQSHEK